ncbi:hydrogenase expression/formation protein [Halomonas sp.]|uniref:hydrogenase expression/formation protein n=1 Tax=Halomonas sp. TaxID=1486246 RepID=UPI00257BCC58|nr:hydrogenase expression/formation protein [Halomonas sp.]MCJ8287260.1 hydrogenase expression/formation protein [Halomonas sp.]NQY71979.1 hydrogenase expression/formation protein [Halomonas sp.]
MTQGFMPSSPGIGPGSQPEEAVLDYLPMPSGMSTFQPSFPEVEDPERIRPALDALSALADRAAEWTPEGGNLVVELPSLDAENRKALADALGEGEVAIKVGGKDAVEIQESVFAGLWRVTSRDVDHDSGSVQEHIEIGVVPLAVVQCRQQRIFCPPDAGQGVVNGPFIVSELIERCEERVPGGEPYAINLSLLPHTPEDLAYLDEALGRGEVTILSRGYGNCRIDSTALDHVWRVRYFNSQDSLILDVIEVSDVPEVACAAAEDIADSVIRLKQVVEAMA